MEMYNLIIIGAGLSGLMAAIECRKNGMDKVVIIERECETGGAIGACVHTGFKYGGRENITIPELITIITREALELGVVIKRNTTAINIEDNRVTTVSSDEGIKTIEGEAILVATGSREKPYGYKNVLGYGAMAGINTVCTTMNCINKKGALPGRKCIILGSDDIGILAAKTLIMEGAEVLAIVETSSSLRATKALSKEIIEEFNIPVLYKHRVTKIIGELRVEGVLIAELDENSKVKPETSRQYNCDALVLCIQLRPDSELVRRCGMKVDEETQKILIDKNYMTSKEGIFACGSVTEGYEDYEDVLRQGREAAHSVIKWSMKRNEG